MVVLCFKKGTRRGEVGGKLARAFSEDVIFWSLFGVRDLDRGSDGTLLYLRCLEKERVGSWLL